MAWSPEFRDYVLEALSGLGAVEARAMFGGLGIFCDGVMIALVADDVLFLKADDQSRGRFEEAGLAQFEFTAKGKTTRMSYWEAPLDIFEDPDAAEDWGRAALDAALRSKR